jgi:cysteinyl-tRNA synthetase
MDDDFNTPEAIAVLFDLASEANKPGGGEAAQLLKRLGSALGLLGRPPEDFLKGELPDGWSVARIEQLIAERGAAKKSKNFKEADRIRQELLDAGIVLEDGPRGTTWRRA